MSLRLSSPDLKRLNAAARVLLSPWSFERGSKWPDEACRAIAPLIGATRCNSVIPLGGEDVWGGDPEAGDAISSFGPPPAWMSRGWERRRALRLDVADWREMCDANRVRASDFYEVVVRAHELWAPLTMYVDLPELPGLLLGGRASTFAFLSFYFPDESSALRALEWRKGLLQLLVPALQSGVRSYIQARRFGARLGELVDRVEIPLAICRRDGSVEHQNGALTLLLQRDSAPQILREAIRRVCQSAAAIVATRQLKAHAHSLAGVPINGIRTDQAQYGVYATVVEAGTYGWPELVLVVVEPRRLGCLTTHDLATRYRLTLREAEALQLLRGGASTRQIAATMQISLNTARRHIERLLMKLGLHSRVAAVAMLEMPGTLD